MARVFQHPYALIRQLTMSTFTAPQSTSKAVIMLEESANAAAVRAPRRTRSSSKTKESTQIRLAPRTAMVAVLQRLDKSLVDGQHQTPWAKTQTL